MVLSQQMPETENSVANPVMVLMILFLNHREIFSGNHLCGKETLLSMCWSFTSVSPCAHNRRKMRRMVAAFIVGPVYIVISAQLRL